MPSGGMELWREADSVLKEEPDVESKKSLREFFCSNIFYNLGLFMPHFALF